MNIDITQIAVAIIALVSAVITGFVIPWIKSKIGVNNDKITDNQRALFKLAVQTAVKAAEQLYYSDEGEKKKSYVINLLENQGYTVNTGVIDAEIEAAVLELHRNLKVTSLE